MRKTKAELQQELDRNYWTITKLKQRVAKLEAAVSKRYSMRWSQAVAEGKAAAYEDSAKMLDNALQ